MHVHFFGMAGKFKRFILEVNWIVLKKIAQWKTGIGNSKIRKYTLYTSRINPVTILSASCSNNLRRPKTWLVDFEQNFSQ